jgi:hypothetical protein
MEVEVEAINDFRIAWELAKQASEAAARAATPELRLLTEIRALMVELVRLQPRQARLIGTQTEELR